MMMKRSILIVIGLVILVAGSAARADEKVRVAVLGDSISKNRNAAGGKGWPLYLGKMLGEGYDVQTFSANGVDCLRVPSISIWQKGELPALTRFEPNIAIIMLGANTARDGVKQYASRYGSDYRATIDYLRAIKSKPKVYCCAPIPVYKDNYGIQAKLLHGVFDPIIRATAKEAGAPLIDCYTPLKDAEGIAPDGVHPSIKGMQAIAAVIYKALLDKEPPADKVAELAKEWQAEEAKRLADEQEKKKADDEAKIAVINWLAERAKNDPKVVELKFSDVLDLKGDGPDGKGNTADDMWSFKFELAHAPGTCGYLDLATQTMPEDQRKNGIRKKVTGPIASRLPNPQDSEGWIFHSDWDGRFEGVWGDKKANCVMLYPYVEKNTHSWVAVQYLVAVEGKYTVSGKVTDVEVQPQFEQHDGATLLIEVAEGDGKGELIRKVGPFGDGGDRPDSLEFKVEKIPVKRGQCLRFAIDPNEWWGSDLTKLELKIERE
ncbi:MAG TPA: GDSL-type esterase/lipase family protein [Phycisphaerae bacterium]|nr:GDSL-type esterase/lipase family protein [Phycisphaerae bacterium]